MADINGDLLIQGSVTATGENLNFKPEVLAVDPVLGTLTVPRIWFNSAEKILKLFNGETIGGVGGGSDGVTPEELETALLPYAETTEVDSAITAAVAALVTTTQLNNAIDSALAGLDFQADVLGLETDFAGVAGRYILVDGLSGITPTVGNANDIVEVTAGGEATVLAYDVSVQGPGALVWNRAAAMWLRWDGATWAEFGGLTGITPGNGIQTVGDVVSIKLDGVTLEVGANGLKLGDISGTYATVSALTAAVADFQTAAQVGALINTALTPYAETTEVTSAITAALAPYATTASVTTAISDAVDGLVNTTELNNAIDNALAGLDFQADVLGLETDFAGVAGRYVYVDGSDFATGVAAAAGDIVTVDAAGAILTVAYDVSAAGPGALAWNRAGVQWIRWNGTDWAEFGGLTGFTAGDGIIKTGDVISLKLDGTTLTLGVNGLKVGDLSALYVTPDALNTALTVYAGEINDLQVQVGGFFVPFDSASALTHTLTHNLGYRWPIVQVVDAATNKVFTPDSIEFTSVNELVITLGVATAIKGSVGWFKASA